MKYFETLNLATQKALYVILNGDFCRLAIPSNEDRSVSLSAELISPAVFDHNFLSQKGIISIEKLWCLSPKTTRMAFLAPKYLKIVQIKELVLVKVTKS